ncbi:MAG: zinc ribbon domain-containing protein [Chloroflexota bacterium]
MRFPGRNRDRGEQAPAPYPSQIICPSCGLRNDPTTRFCRNCGLPLGAPSDPVRGTTSRRADLPSEHGAGIAAMVGLGVAVVLLGGAAFLILRNNSDSGDTGNLPAATAKATPKATAQAGGVEVSLSPEDSLAPTVTAQPDPSRDPGGPVATLPPRDTPDPGTDPFASASPGPLVADTGETCSPADFRDPTNSKWKIVEARWGGRNKYDELTIVLRKDSGEGSSDFAVESMDSTTAAQISGLDPAPGSQVILITFDGDISIKSPIVAKLSEKQLNYLNVESTDEATYAVVGVNRDTCYRLYVPAWKKGQDVAVGDTVTLLLDTRYR